MTFNQTFNGNDQIMSDYMILYFYSYLTIVPSHLLSAPEVAGDGGITYYLIEAHQQVHAFSIIEYIVLILHD